MIRIGIELNGVVRDINSQILKYYVKDIDKSFDDKSADKNSLNVINYLPFKESKYKNEFLYVDYPYEIFGCAKAMSRNLPNTLNNWYKNLENIEKEKFDVKLFSLFEEGLSIQSTYFFLSKIGCRIREILMPFDSLKLWDCCDVVITTNGRLITNKPNGKVSVLINKTENASLKEKADFNYDTLDDVLNDVEFLSNIIGVLNAKEVEYTEVKSKKFDFINKIMKLLK